MRLTAGHYLGIDVHDTGCVPRDLPLEPGVVLALEPGLYIPDEDRYGAFRGLGVRIEDDVLITDQGAVVLSRGAPTAVDDVERIVGSHIMGSDELPFGEGTAVCGSL